MALDFRGLCHYNAWLIGRLASRANCPSKPKRGMKPSSAEGKVKTTKAYKEYRYFCNPRTAAYSNG